MVGAGDVKRRYRPPLMGEAIAGRRASGCKRPRFSLPLATAVNFRGALLTWDFVMILLVALTAAGRFRGMLRACGAWARQYLIGGQTDA